MILDTNALAIGTCCAADELALPVIAFSEYLYGIRQSRLRARYEEWLNANIPLFDVLAVGEEAARHYAEIRRELKDAGAPVPSNDIRIAALARQRRSALVSRDRHFQAIKGLRLVTW